MTLKFRVNQRIEPSDDRDVPREKAICKIRGSHELFKAF